MIEAARTLKEKVIGLIAVDALTDVEKKLTKEENDEFVALMQKDFKNGIKDKVKATMFTEKSDPLLVEQIAEKISRCSPEAGMKAWQAVYEYDLPAAMDSIGRSFWNINSDMRPTNIEAGERHVRQFVVESMTGVGHFPMLENPGAFQEVLLPVTASIGANAEPLPKELKGPPFRESQHHFLLGLEAGWSSSNGKHLILGTSFLYCKSSWTGLMIAGNVDLYNLIAKKDYGTCFVGINYYPPFINYPAGWIFASAGIGVVRSSWNASEAQSMSNHFAVELGGGFRSFIIKYRLKVVPFFEAKAIFSGSKYYGRYTSGIGIPIGGSWY